MSIENVTYAFQNAATTGVGINQFFLEPRFTTFRITGNGSVTGGAVPANSTVDYRAGIVSGTFRARISTPVTGGTVTVLAIRPEDQKGWSRRPP
jgi:hypothetical protein